MPEQVITIATLASEAYECFETATRPDGESFQRVRDGSPEWLSDLSRAAHDDGAMLPDDWRYDAIHSALEYLSEDEDEDEDGHEFADGNVDAYNGQRLDWLASHSARPGYVDQAREDGLIGPDSDLLEAIGVGQYVESLEVFEQVREFLQDRLDMLEEEADDDEPDIGALRHTASEWHGGQTSALYAFSSSGTVIAGLASEVRQCFRELDRQPEHPRNTDRSDLSALLAFADANEPDDDEEGV